MKILVIYYSRSGNNRFIAEKLAQELGGDLYEIVPRLKAFFFYYWRALQKSVLEIKK